MKRKQLKQQKTDLLANETQLYSTQQCQQFENDVKDVLGCFEQRKMSQLIEKFTSVDDIVVLHHSNPITGLQQEQIKQHLQLLDALKDTTIIILIISAILQLILTTTVIKPEELEWIDGCAILISIIVVVLVTSCNDFQKEKQFRILNDLKENKKIRVIRDSKIQEIPISEVVVGDIVQLSVGDQIPADGILINSYDMKVDESKMTGESEEIFKSVERDCFMIGSCLIRSGSGQMLVVGVGKNSVYGDILIKLQENDEQTPLQIKLEQMAKLIGYIGTTAAVITFAALIARFFAAGKHHNPKNFVEWADYFVLAITIIVVAVPEGLPLAVTISLAYSMKAMLRDKCLVRKMQSCETMGAVSNICTDKTGTLTLNQMRVVRARIGNLIFKSNNVYDPLQLSFGGEIKQKICPDVSEIIAMISSCCTTADLQIKNSHQTIIGCKTEGALLFLNRELGFDHTQLRLALTINNRFNGAIKHVEEFSSDSKKMTVVIDNKQYRCATLQKKYTVLHKGAPEVVLQQCTQIMLENGQITDLSKKARENIFQDINGFCESCLRCLVMAFKYTDEDLVQQYQENLVFVALVAIQDPLRQNVKQSILRCQNAGITVRMVTGDSKITAFNIARECGILKKRISLQSALSKGNLLEGSDFNKLSDQEIDLLLPKLLCLARAAPKDKYRFIQRLKANNQIVAATGDGSNDALQLKAADVGLAMGISGTEVAKEASDMIIMNDAFDTIVKAVAWGRTVTANVRKFLQFQLTVNVVALVIAFLGAAILEESALTSIQLLYVNLIMDSLGSLALATEKPNAQIMKQKPVEKHSFFITPRMTRNILLVSLYQIIIILLMMFDGVGDFWCLVPQQLLGNDLQLNQIFNEFNSRRINSDVTGVFSGVFKNPMFITVIIATTVVQLCIMLVPGVKNVFNIYDCQNRFREAKCFSLQQVPSNISMLSFCASIDYALLVFIVHFLGRFCIRLKDEYKLSAKKSARNGEKQRKRNNQSQ